MGLNVLLSKLDLVTMLAVMIAVLYVTVYLFYRFKFLPSHEILHNQYEEVMEKGEERKVEIMSYLKDRFIDMKQFFNQELEEVRHSVEKQEMRTDNLSEDVREINSKLIKYEVIKGSIEEDDIDTIKSDVKETYKIMVDTAFFKVKRSKIKCEMYSIGSIMPEVQDQLRQKREHSYTRYMSLGMDSSHVTLAKDTDHDLTTRFTLYMNDLIDFTLQKNIKEPKEELEMREKCSEIKELMITEWMRTFRSKLAIT